MLGTYRENYLKRPNAPIRQGGSVSGFFVRTEKRSPYLRPDYTQKHSAQAQNNVGFTCLTLLLLLLVYPLGLILLWNRKNRFSSGVKMLLTLAAAIAFCIMLVFAANVETDNPRIASVQEYVNQGLDWVYEHTNAALTSLGGTAEHVGEEFSGKLSYIWENVGPNAAQAGVKLLGGTAENVREIKQSLPKALLSVMKNYSGYTEPKQSQEPRTQNPLAGIVLTSPTPAPTRMLAATPVPTMAPTPEPTPTPMPVELPEIRDVAEAPVYYTPGGTYYHLISNCSGMLGASSHTLKEAVEAKKQVCPQCSVVSTAMMERAEKDYLWVDAKNVAHTTDICRDFYKGTYRVIPFDDVYAGHFTYCPKCHADVCFEYMRQHDSAYNVNETTLDPVTKLIYEYEKTVPVYYSKTSRYYHSSQDCQQMYDDKYTHSLYEALHQDGKNPCPECNPFNEGDVREKLAN